MLENCSKSSELCSVNSLSVGSISSLSDSCSSDLINFTNCEMGGAVIFPVSHSGPVKAESEVHSASSLEFSNRYSQKYLLSSAIEYIESDTRNNDIELQYDTDLDLNCSLAKDVAYVYDDWSVPSFCDSSVMNSSEKVSNLSEDTFVYNISSNELSTENYKLRLENTFESDGSEISSHYMDVTDRYDSVSDGYNQDSEATYIYDSSLESLESADSVYVEYFNQDEIKQGKS